MIMGVNKVLVAMSGGVDSTVSAYLLQQQGYTVEGIYMKLKGSSAYHEKNLQNIQTVSEFLGINYHILDLSEPFHAKVYDYFVEGYQQGTTPNPCIICNREIKFGALWEKARELGFELLATGHYVQVDNGVIKEAVDKSKDQSYFLAQVDQSILPHMLFPLGGRLKSDVKELAKNIPPLKAIAEQKESSEICFVEHAYTDLLQQHMDIDLPGEVVDSEGNVIGEHRGYMHYTIGKRRGFRVYVSHVPNYVIDIDAKNNRLIVGPKEELACSEFLVRDININEESSTLFCEVKIRYRSPKVQCSVEIHSDRSAKVILSEPVYGVASGQFAVFYRVDELLGGGEIVGK
jgi:tRNA-specific 2-thiouridylase